MGVLSIAFLLMFVLDLPELGVRLMGLVLQLLGLCTVLIGISQTRSRFGLPSMRASALAWVKRFPRVRLKPVEGKLVAILANVEVTSHVNARLSLSADSPLEHRVSAVESNLAALEHAVDGLRDQLDQTDRQRGEALALETQTRQEAVRRLSDELALAETGGLSLSLVGLVWLSAGLIITTLSPEIAAWR